MKVLVYDDNIGRQDALMYLIREQKDMHFLAAFRNCNNVIDEVGKLAPDVILMDIDMPGINGIEGLKLIRKNFPKVMIIMQTVFEDDEVIFEAIQAGAHGYFLKSTPPQKLIDGIKEVLEGGAPMTSIVARKVLESFRFKESNHTHNKSELTDAELRILSELVKGISYKMIAENLSISYHTVNGHIKKIYEKLHVNSATEAVIKAIDKNLLPRP